MRKLLTIGGGLMTLLNTTKTFWIKCTSLILIVISITSSSCNAQNLSQQITNAMGERIYLTIKGKLLVKESTSNTQLILVRSLGNPDKNFDKAFIIFSSTPISKLLLNENDEYEIQIPENKKFATIYNITRNRIHFIGTSDKSTDIGVIKRKPEISQAITNEDYLGYGFSYLTGQWLITDIKESKYKKPFNTLDFANILKPQLRESLLEDEIDGGGDDADLCVKGSCTSGGNGSTSCSITEAGGMSCTVSCTAGFYACCNSSTTRCYCCKY